MFRNKTWNRTVNPPNKLATCHDPLFYNHNITHNTHQYNQLLPRSRMGLSALNAHCHRCTFIPIPTCPFCKTSAETSLQYFNCLSQTLALNMFNRLQHQLDLETTSLQHLLETIYYGRNIHPRNYTKLLDIIYQYLKLKSGSTNFVSFFTLFLCTFTYYIILQKNLNPQKLVL